MTVTAPGSDVIRIGARVTSAGTTSHSGYYVAISGTGGWSILRIDAGASTTLITGPTQTLAAGDKIAIRIVGSVITALHFSAGNWQQVTSYDTAADSTKYTAAGSLALEFKQHPRRLRRRHALRRRRPPPVNTRRAVRLRHDDGGAAAHSLAGNLDGLAGADVHLPVAAL